MGNESDNQKHSSTDISADMSHISSSSTSHRRYNSAPTTPFTQKQKSDDEDRERQPPLKSDKSFDIKPKEIRVIYLSRQPDLSFVYFCPYCGKTIPYGRYSSASTMRKFFKKLVSQREGIDADIHLQIFQSEEAFQHLPLQYPERVCIDHDVIISDDENVEDSEVSSLNFIFSEDSDDQNLLHENESDVRQFSDIITPNSEILSDGLIESEDDATTGNPIPVTLYVTVTVTCTLILY